MGGGIAQRIALDHPDRAASLVLQSTTPFDAGGPDRPALPPMEPRIAALFAADTPGPDWSDRDAAIDAMIDGERMFVGTLPLDTDRLRRVVTRAYDRTADMAAMQTNHWILEDGEPPQKRVRDIAAPTLVLHGTDDPLFPFAHGEALAREIPGARLLPLLGLGHQYPLEPLWDLVIREIVAHTDR